MNIINFISDPVYQYDLGLDLDGTGAAENQVVVTLEPVYAGHDGGGGKIDFCEQISDHIPLVFADGRGSSGAHHWYPTMYDSLMYRFYQRHRS